MNYSRPTKATAHYKLFKGAGADIMKKIYGGKAKFIRMIPGRYTQQPLFQLRLDEALGVEETDKK